MSGFGEKCSGCLGHCGSDQDSALKLCLSDEHQALLTGRDLLLGSHGLSPHEIGLMFWSVTVYENMPLIQQIREKCQLLNVSGWSCHMNGVCGWFQIKRCQRWGE